MIWNFIAIMLAGAGLFLLGIWLGYELKKRIFSEKEKCLLEKLNVERGDVARLETEKRWLAEALPVNSTPKLFKPSWSPK